MITKTTTKTLGAGARDVTSHRVRCVGLVIVRVQANTLLSTTFEVLITGNWLKEHTDVG